MAKSSARSDAGEPSTGIKIFDGDIANLPFGHFIVQFEIGHNVRKAS
jgi:hypothetical protein